jgi:hypothetical protein
VWDLQACSRGAAPKLTIRALGVDAEMTFDWVRSAIQGDEFNATSGNNFHRNAGRSGLRTCARQPQAARPNSFRSQERIVHEKR